MRFTKLVVESFQAVQHAEVEFGPGLNILYGPNDLGKSTLATAIRAALLVPPGSAEASTFAPWYADAVPLVSLSFTDDAGHHWRVKKGFGSSGARAGAELFHSKDGSSFVADSKARQVEETLRRLLSWGIPAPGGKGGPRGLPTSFLSQVLLGSQTDVDSVLGKSLADDLDGTGKLRLTTALATLAQDPLFKKVLDAAQREVDQCFTPTGQRTRAKGSRFLAATQLVKQLQEELRTLERQLTDSASIEETVNVHRERRARAVMREGDSAVALAAVRERVTKTREREEAIDRLDVATAAVHAIDAHAAKVDALSAEVDALTVKVQTREEDASRSLSRSAGAEAGVRAAEEAHRVATSEDGARERELRRARLGEEAAGVNAKKQAARGRRAEISAAVSARAGAKAARAAAAAAQATFAKVALALEGHRGRVKNAERDVELARAILAYGRWRAAVSAAADGAKAAVAAADARAEADAKDVEAAALDGEARATDDELASRRAALPEDEEVSSLARLERDLEIAEAALGGGLSVAVRPRTGVRIQASLDHAPPVDEPNLASERVFDAERHVRLSVGDLVDIEISAGAADQRRSVEELRARWTAEAVPALARAAVTSVAEIAGALAVIAKDSSRAADVKRRASQLRVDAKAARERAAERDAQAAKLAASPSDLEAREQAIGTAERAALQAGFEKLGKGWESAAEALHRHKTSESKGAQAQLATEAPAAKVAEYQVSETELNAAKAAAAAETASSSVGGGDPEALLHAVDDEVGSLGLREAQIAEEIAALAAEATGQAAAATKALEAAQAQLTSAREAHTAAVAALDAAKAELNARTGERTVLRSQLDGMDRAGALALSAQRDGELAARPPVAAASVADVADAEREVEDAKRELEAAKEELHKSEGALSKVGGRAVRDEVDRVKEALKAATLRERDLEVDADAWKMLRDTLREVENEEGAHLGRALAGPVAARFGELTGGRYQNLRLDAKLQTESLDAATGVADGTEVLRALSIGTRDQLATLIRLTIADQLRTAIVLDDHLVHSDPRRLAWFRDVLTKTAVSTQVIVFTCRPEDYVSKSELPDGAAMRDLAGGAVRVVDMARVVKRWEGIASVPPPAEVHT